MTIGELLSSGFGYARRCRGLWLFGFLAGITSGGSGGGSGRGGGIGPGGLGPHIPPAWFGPILLVGIALALGAVLLHFLSEGALIEGVARTRRGETVTTGQGFRYGSEHFWVLLRIGLLVGLVFLLSLTLLACPIFLALHFGGWPLGLAAGLIAALVGMPWLITLVMIRAFAARIAVLENRRALDALRRARLFLHRRILLGLKVIVATFVAGLVIALVAGMAIVPTVLLLVGLAMPLHMLAAAIVLGCILLLPILFMIGAISGLTSSSIWTVGYLSEAAA